MKMHHPETGGEIDIPDSAVHVYERSGWVEGAASEAKPGRRTPLPPAEPERSEPQAKKPAKTSD